MRADSNSELLELQRDIKMSLKDLEGIVLSEKPVKLTEKKEAFLCLKEKIRTLVTYSEYLQTYGDSSYESSIVSEK